MSTFAMHKRLRQKFRAASAAATASRTRSRLERFVGHEPQHALLIAAQSASVEHASHVAGIASTRVGKPPDADGATVGGDSMTGSADATATSFGTGASVRHATSAIATATTLTA
jgi:hypothetical protein